MGSGEAREGMRNGRSDGEMHKAGGLGVSRERKQKKVKEKCFKKLLSTSDRMGPPFLHFLKATFFFFPTESLPVVWLPSIFIPTIQESEKNIIFTLATH